MASSTRATSAVFIVTDHLFDPYAILEVPQDADFETVRKAFRRLAMRWHPDRNADPRATERFKEIRAAFDWLSSESAPAEEGDAGEATEPGPGGRRGADRHDDLVVTLAEAMLGCDKPWTIRRRSACPTCEGTGAVPLRHTRMCEICHGSGKVRTPKGLETCHLCRGRGFVQRAACDACGGSGEVFAEREVTVHVAAGLLPGEVLRLKGLGEVLEDGQSPGTLFLTLRLAEDPLFALEGRDIVVSQPISALRLLIGGRISVAGPLGPVLVDLPPGTPGGQGLRLPGQGFPGRGGALDSAGALVLRFDPLLPEALDAAQVKALAALEQGLQAHQSVHYPALERWWQDYRASRD